MKRASKHTHARTCARAHARARTHTHLSVCRHLAAHRAVGVYSGKYYEDEEFEQLADGASKYHK